MYPSLMSAFWSINTSGPKDLGPNGVLVGNNCAHFAEFVVAPGQTPGQTALRFWGRTAMVWGGAVFVANSATWWRPVRQLKQPHRPRRPLKTAFDSECSSTTPPSNAEAAAPTQTLAAASTQDFITAARDSGCLQNIPAI